MILDCLDMDKNLVDYHCHLDLYPDFEKVIEECEAEEIYTLTVTTTPRAWPKNLELTKEKKYVRAALGLHPQLVSERSSEISIWREYLDQTQYVGEVGLDAGPRFYRSFDLQKKVFEDVLRSCADAKNKILTIHSVRTVPTVLDMMECFLPQNSSKVVLHWFTGSMKDARRAVDRGYFFSINAEMLKNTRHRNLIKELPLSRILTETDGPFTSQDGKPTRPSNVDSAVETLAKLKNTDLDLLKNKILNNLNDLESL